MISKLFVFVLACVTMLYVYLPPSIAAMRPTATHASADLRLDRSQHNFAPSSVGLHGFTHGSLDLSEPARPHTDKVLADRSAEDQRSSSMQTVKEGDIQKSLEEPLEQQLVAQVTPKEHAITTRSDRGNADNQLSQELSVMRNSLDQAKQRIDELERQLADGNLETAKRRIGELVIQLHAKDSELATLRSSAHENSKKLREDLAVQAEELNQAKRRIAEVEHQLAGGKGQDLAQAKRRAAEAEQQTARKEQELMQAKRRAAELEQQTAGKDQELAQAKRRVADLEQQMTAKEYESAQAKRRANELEQQMAGKEQDLAQAKRRITEAEQQTAGKEQELAQNKRRAAELEQQMAGKVQDPTQTKRRATELEQQMASKEQELLLAKRRVTELEQQLAGKEQDPTQIKRRVAELEQQMTVREQDLALAKRRVTELEQQVAGKEQDPAQIKRRVTELEQQMAGKEQELAQVKDNLKQVTQKYADLGPMLMDRDAELARMKQSLEDLERSVPKPDEALPSLEVSPVAKHTLSELPPDASLSVTDLPLPHPDGADALSGDLTKVNETLSTTFGTEIKKGSLALRQERSTLTLTLISGELFAPGEAAMTPLGHSLIGQIATILQKFRYGSIEVVTHTDSKPIRNDSRKLFRDNMELSRARVEHATQALIDSGVDATRVKAVVYTAAKPTAPNDTEGRNKNRRIEIVVSASEAAGHSSLGRLQPSKKSPRSISLSSPRRP